MTMHTPTDSEEFPPRQPSEREPDGGRTEPPAAHAARGDASAPPQPPHWTAWLPPDMEIRPRRRRRFAGCFLVLLGMAIAGILVAVITGSTPLTEVPMLSSGAASGSQMQEHYIGGDPNAQATIAVVDVKGVIVSSEHVDVASVPRITAALKQAAARPDVVAVVLDMNTPGGEVTASDEIHNAVQQVRGAGKPVITCMRSLAASGGYYIAAGTDYIVANRLTITGSIGVLMSSVNYAELLDKIGVQADFYKSGEMKDLLNGAVERSPEEQEMQQQLLQGMVDKTFMEFAKIVAEGRGFSSAQYVREASFGDGRVLSGEEALRHNLVDKLGYFSDAVAKAMEAGTVTQARVVRFQQRVPMLDRILGMQARSGVLPEAVLPAEIRELQPGRLYYLMPLVSPAAGP